MKKSSQWCFMYLEGMKRTVPRERIEAIQGLMREAIDPRWVTEEMVQQRMRDSVGTY